MRALAASRMPSDPSRMKATEDRRAREFVRDLDAALKRVLAQVTPTSTPADIQRIVDNEFAGFTPAAKEKVLKWVQDTEQRAILRSEQLLKASGIPTGAILGPALPLPKDIRDALDIGVQQEIDSLTADVKKKLTASLIDGLQAGEGAKDLGKRVAEDLAMDRTRAELIARTETMRAFNTTAVEAYKKAEVSKVMFFAASDERTCDQCGALHTKVFDIPDAPSLPIHPRCRCTYLPVGDEA